MRREHALVWIALGCGIALLLAPLGDRTYWEQWGQGISRNYDNMPYDFLAFFAGVGHDISFGAFDDGQCAGDGGLRAGGHQGEGDEGNEQSGE